MSDSPALQLHQITKRFGAATALDGVDFTLQKGEIHALLGENGAGKSTLMNIVRGLLAPTSGRLEVDGRTVRFSSPQDAARAGIGMVHQHFLLVPVFTVLENLALASKQSGWRLRLPELRVKALEIARRLGWEIPLDRRVADLPVGTQQRVEILKALLDDARILLFDEPTAVLAPTEIGELFHVLQSLRAEGRSLVFVSHKLNEVMALCDRVTVLRRGRWVATEPISTTGPERLARQMVGDEAEALLTAEAPAVSEETADAGPRLSVLGLATAPARDAVPLVDLTFDVRPGEILGFAGVDGNGQTELAQVLTGLRPWTGGFVTWKGDPLPSLRPADLGRLGIGVIPPDRHREGLALSFTVAENLMLEAARRPEFRAGPFLKRRALRAFAETAAREYDVRTPSLDLPAAALSGGNQQKIVLARALSRRPDLLIAVSPTRGLDVAATAAVHARLRQRRREGGAILLISTELEEVLSLSDRVAVLYEGRIQKIVPPDTSRETLGLLMGGGGHG